MGKLGLSIPGFASGIGIKFNCFNNLNVFVVSQPLILFKLKKKEKNYMHNMF